MQGVPIRLPIFEVWPYRVMASVLHFDNGVRDGFQDREDRRVMRRVVASLLLLLLAVIHAPTQAQAVVFSVFGDLFPFGTNEPGMLFLTGVTLLSLAYVGGRSR
jgi:hypothetical protein